MAATLIHIKSKMLLPRDPELEKISPEDDPRQELVDRLLEHERFKNAAEMLQQKRVIEEAVWSNPQIEQFRAEEDDPGLAVTLFDLVKTFAERAGARQEPAGLRGREGRRLGAGHDPLSASACSASCERDESVPARELFERQRSRRAMICLFLAMLELVKLQALALTQAERVRRNRAEAPKRFEAAFAAERAAGRTIEEGIQVTEWKNWSK